MESPRNSRLKSASARRVSHLRELRCRLDAETIILNLTTPVGNADPVWKMLRRGPLVVHRYRD
jgi:hypothetical protein